MKIINLFPGSYNSNCYILVHGGEAVVIDPSASAKSILSRVEQEGAALKGILLTHGHFDHIVSIDTLRRACQVPLMIHKEDAEMLEDGVKNAFSLFFGQDISYKPAERHLENGDKISLGGMDIEVVHLPGHSKGSVCYYSPGERTMFTGDLLFAQGYGRADLHGGNAFTLRTSLCALRQYPGNITIYPGHGEASLLRNALDVAFYL
ncbi:MAG: MBL fold metallo-hydrolase [Clostridia bacterium]|nr:MBL fold metallo-hydrolase [Clostridia bacterium]